MSALSRRQFVGITGTAAVGLAIGCTPTEPGIPFATGGRLNARPSDPTDEAAPGLQTLREGTASRIFVPSNRAPGERFPLMVLFHGAGGSPDMWFGSYANRAENARMALLAVNSRATTWDLFSVYGPDVEFLDGALETTFDKVWVDPAKIYVAGFSDGASYSLAIGLTNGDLFSRVVAFSPGLLGGVDPHGKPRVAVTHGVQDEVLPIDRTSRRIVPMLRKAGYDTHYGEFNGSHEVPSHVSDSVFEWLRTD